MSDAGPEGQATARQSDAVRQARGWTGSPSDSVQRRRRGSPDGSGTFSQRSRTNRPLTPSQTPRQHCVRQTRRRPRVGVTQSDTRSAGQRRPDAVGLTRGRRAGGRTARGHAAGRTDGGVRPGGWDVGPLVGRTPRPLDAVRPTERPRQSSQLLFARVDIRMTRVNPTRRDTAWTRGLTPRPTTSDGTSGQRSARQRRLCQTLPGRIH